MSQGKVHHVLPIDIEALLSEAIERRPRKGEPKSPENLDQAIRYSLLAPGKRIRPKLALSCAGMLGLPRDLAQHPAVAIEMIHCFTLIHDDLPCMDNDDIRRGQPSCHKKFGEALALLAGDALIGLAFELFQETHRNEHFPRALKRFIAAIGPRGVVGGQAAEFLLDESSSFEDLMKTHAMKTASLFSAALLIPKDLAGLPDDSSEGLAIEAFGRELGLAFQALDDLRDAHGAPDPTSIVYYMQKPEVIRMNTQRLHLATESLRSIWAEKAQPLIEISDEIIRSLGTHAPDA